MDRGLELPLNLITHRVFLALSSPAFLLGPSGGLLAEQKSPADVQVTFAEDLRFPAIALAVKPQLARPGDVILPDGPD